MRVNCVVKPGWILERLARELERQLPDVTVNAGKDSRATDPRADLQYYLPARDCHKVPCAGKAVGFYTHGDSGFELIPRFAGVGAMNRAMAARLMQAGASDVAVIRPGVEPGKAIAFGVIGRVYNNGRKGEGLVREAMRAGFTFVACQAERRVSAMTKRQWPCPSPFTIEQRVDFYRAIDYLVVTSTEEGGPMPVAEAIAHGVPVIAPDVGWCWEFPLIRYERGSWDSLRAVLEGLTQPPTWAEWAEGHRRWFARLGAQAA